MTKAPGILAAGALAGALAAGPAYAHGGDAPDATAYRTTVTAITPAEPGLQIRAVEAGARLELVNRTGRTVEVLGYSGEPYLEVRPDGTFENVHSPATYLNRTLTGTTPVPATADPTAPPQWRRVTHDAAVRWHDHRTHWMSSQPPPTATADPDRKHRLRTWEVPLRDGVRTFAVRGTLDWEPPPNPTLWWAGALLTAAAVTALGALATRRRGLVRAVGAVAAVAGTTTIGYAAARTLDAGTNGPGDLLRGLLTGQLTPVLAGLGALAAGGIALTRRQSDFALALAGAGLALFGGLTNLGVFTRAVAPVPGPSWPARVAVLVAVGAGLGLLAAGVLRLRAAPPPPATADDPAAPPLPRDTHDPAARPLPRDADDPAARPLARDADDPAATDTGRPADYRAEHD